MREPEKGGKIEPPTPDSREGRMEQKIKKHFEMMLNEESYKVN
jgi:hypothetical protein